MIPEKVNLKSQNAEGVSIFSASRESDSGRFLPSTSLHTQPIRIFVRLNPKTCATPRSRLRVI